MFTGLIEQVGIVTECLRRSHSLVLTVSHAGFREPLRTGDSVAVNGVCLTAVACTATTFTAEAMPETVRHTNLPAWQAGTAVNLERALRVGDRLDGHWVTGHVDGCGRIIRIATDEIAELVTIEVSPELGRQIVRKGSIAIDGISLTVTEASAHRFTVGVIPHTRKHTALRDKRTGSIVHIETDILGKYVLQQLQYRRTYGEESLQQALQAAGFAVEGRE